MTFLFPGFLWAAGAVALGVIALHLIVTQQPQSDVLPTVRFFPDVPARSTSVAIRPSDLLLLLTRLLIITLLGLAFAQPQLKPKHFAVARIVAVDVSRAVRSRSELADSARRYTDGAAAVVWFDSNAYDVPLKAVKDSIAALTSASATAKPARRGSLSPALITMLRAASRVRTQGDSLELVVVSPFAEEERDGATGTVRALFPGHLRGVRVAAASDSSLSQSGLKTVVHWADSGAATGWTARPKADTAGAVRAEDAVMVFPFVRKWSLAANDAGARVSARWVDGEPAAVERVSGGECVRSIAIVAPTGGDVVLRPDYARLMSTLRGPCGATHNLMPMSPEALTAFQGPDKLAAVNGIKPRVTKVTPIVPWLLAGALLFALLELLVRRISGSAAENEDAVAPAQRTTPRQAA